MGGRSSWADLREFFANDPMLAVALGAAVIALATTPVAFAVLGRMGWFQARRGRTIQRPSFAAVVVGMMLVLAVPAILVALLVKSRHFDEDRYEFDPNRTISVLDQGRQFESLSYRESLYKADEAVRAEMKRLAEERKNLVEHVKKLDEAMLALRAASGTSPSVAQTMPDVLQRLAGLRKSIGVDGPQQLMDFTAPPASLPAAVANSMPTPAANVPPIAPAATNGLSEPERQAEVAAAPEPQRPLAAMLPLSDVPAGWAVGKGMGREGKSRLETFNAENLYEKINGRAESFLQYGVKGMAYTFYHPVGDESTEVQLYIFEMGDPLKALGKYGSEKPDGVTAMSLGAEGYSTAGSTFFYAGKYYTQIVSTKDDPKVAAFSLELAKKIVSLQQPGSAPSPGAPTVAVAADDPTALLKLLPNEPGKANPKYVARDVFGYSFLSDVFLADYTEGGATFQGFLRSYPTPEEAKAVFEKYVETAQQDGAKIVPVEGVAADRMVVAANADVGLTDVIFLKGNSLAGANGAADSKPAEAFARAFAQTLPDRVPFIPAEKKESATEGTEGTEKNED